MFPLDGVDQPFQRVGMVVRTGFVFSHQFVKPFQFIAVSNGLDATDIVLFCFASER